MIRDRIHYIQDQMADAAAKAGRDLSEITLIGVTKTVEAEVINEAIDAGITCIGENRVQELLQKLDALKPVEKHLIGTLQSNKAQSIIDVVTLIHSLDRLRLAQKLHELAEKRGQCIDVLVQVNIGMEDTKSGINPQDLLGFLDELQPLSGIRVKGLMCIPPFCQLDEARAYFERTRELAQRAQIRHYEHMTFDVLSMGMSHDFQQAICAGATHIRVGQAIFGRRNGTGKRENLEEL